MSAAPPPGGGKAPAPGPLGDSLHHHSSGGDVGGDAPAADPMRFLLQALAAETDGRGLDGLNKGAMPAAGRGAEKSSRGSPPPRYAAHTNQIKPDPRVPTMMATASSLKTHALHP